MRSTSSVLLTVASMTVGAAAVTSHTLTVSGSTGALARTGWAWAVKLADDIEAFTRVGPIVSAVMLILAVCLAADRRTAARRTGWLLVVVSVSLAACARFIDWVVITAGVSQGAGPGPYILYAAFAAAGLAMIYGSRFLPGSDKPGLPSFRPTVR